ncbi:hypothetical protein [Anaerovorax odorimutans]|uniref:hypothetical protein n=1 Tax=Anaerovorax odorimutans TaxID=109327 RepID=UPI000414F8B3|nr:hypothetical protein [Anaerovorax odorimutans]
MSEKTDNIKRIKLLITIVERGSGDRVIKFYRKNGITFNMVSPGYGTAGPEVMHYLGLTDYEKDIILSIITEDRVSETINKTRYYFDLDRPGNGIVFAIPICGVSGPLALKYISGLQFQERS